MIPEEIDFTFLIGGEAGQGIQSMGQLLGKTLTRGGFFVFGDQDYESRIRGGHNFFRIRVRNSPVKAIDENLDLLIAVNRETVELHRSELKKGGVGIFDSDAIENMESDGILLGVPMRKLAEEKAGSQLMSNTVGLGAAMFLINYKMDLFEKVLKDFFGAKNGEPNVNAARAGYEFARDNFQLKFDRHLVPGPESNRLFMSGTDAIALGALAAGCKFISAYPMTPATPIMEYMASRSGEMDVVVVQPEDEISAINMAVGAGYAGVRSMTATSGSGFCLMTEGLGLAGITETPVVIVNSMRPGPAVGLPTRSEQGDLEFVISAHQGFFPRAVLSPNCVEDCFWLTIRAFNIADVYQTPVIILPDHFISTTHCTLEEFDLSKVKIDRGLLLGKTDVRDYKRHQITGNGISPRAFPGRKDLVVVTDADEHGEEGHIIEDAHIRDEMVRKRLRKFEEMKKTVVAPEIHGPAKADITLIGWGSSYGAVEEAASILSSEDSKSVNWFNFNEIWPFPGEQIKKVLADNPNCFLIESNPNGQLAHIVRAETGVSVKHSVLKYDGRPITPAYIVNNVRKEGR